MSALDPHLPVRPPARADADFAQAALAVQLVALSMGLSARDITTRSRGDARIARARHMAMYLAHTGFGWPLARVAQAFGRDRTTAAHACAAVEDGRDDPRFDAQLEALEAMLRAAPEGLIG